MAARDLLVRVLGDTRDVENAFARSSRAANQFGASVATTGQKADKAARNLRGFATGAAAGFGGAIAFNAGINAVRSLIDAAAESEQVLGQTRVALESTGKSWQQYGERIEDAIASQSRLGFDDEALLRTFSLFVRQSRDVEEAIRRNAIAMNLARARFIDLEQAANLVNKAALGQAGALRRVGIDARNGASGVELLAQLERQFAGAAVDASNSATGATDRLAVSVENAQEAFGTLLLPAVEEFSNSGAEAVDIITDLVGVLGDLGRVKIPTIVIPFTTKEVGGGTVGSKAGKVAGIGLLGAISPAALFAVGVKEAIDRIRGEAPPSKDINNLAKTFDDQFASFTNQTVQAVNKSIDRANRNGAAAFGQAGFKPLEVNELGASLQRQFDGVMDALDLKLDKAAVTADTADDLSILNEIEAAIRARIKTQGRTTELLRELFQVQQARQAILDGIARQNEENRQAGIDKMFGNLGLAVSRAELTSGLADDLDALFVLRNALKKQIAAGGDVLQYQTQLVSVEQQIAAKEQQRADNARTIVQAKQFRALGLSKTGEEIIPGAKNLKTRVDQALRLVGTGQLDISDKLVSRLKLAGKLIAKEGKKLTAETRAVINDLLKTVNQGSDKLEGPLTKTTGLNAEKIVAGLGLSPEAERELRARLSGFNSAGRALAGDVRATGKFVGGPVGTRPVVVENHNTTVLDGEVVGRNVTKSQQKTRRRNPVQKRGPNSGV